MNYKIMAKRRAPKLYKFQRRGVVNLVDIVDAKNRKDREYNPLVICGPSFSGKVSPFDPHLNHFN